MLHYCVARAGVLSCLLCRSSSTHAAATSRSTPATQLEERIFSRWRFRVGHVNAELPQTPSQSGLLGEFRFLIVVRFGSLLKFALEDLDLSELLTQLSDLFLPRTECFNAELPQAPSQSGLLGEFRFLIVIRFGFLLKFALEDLDLSELLTQLSDLFLLRTERFNAEFPQAPPQSGLVGEFCFLIVVRFGSSKFALEDLDLSELLTQFSDLFLCDGLLLSEIGDLLECVSCESLDDRCRPHLEGAPLSEIGDLLECASCESLDDHCRSHPEGAPLSEIGDLLECASCESLDDHCCPHSEGASCKSLNDRCGSCPATARYFLIALLDLRLLGWTGNREAVIGICDRLAEGRQGHSRRISEERGERGSRMKRRRPSRGH